MFRLVRKSVLLCSSSERKTFGKATKLWIIQGRFRERKRKKETSWIVELGEFLDEKSSSSNITAELCPVKLETFLQFSAPASDKFSSKSGRK